MKPCPACQHEFQVSADGEIPYRCPHCGALVLGRYCDLKWIGGGGMGDVYRAREPEMGDRTVAIKIPKTEVNAARAQRRFEREIAASARLQHENAVRAYHRGTEGGRPYLVMEFVSGRKLSDVVWQEHPLAPRRVARIALGVARGLDHAGRQGVVNRDIKPENIFLAEPDETTKILDYGLALITDPDEQVTRDGALLGTPKYIAPEQFRDPHSVKIAADVYSLGCTVYYCLTGHAPFPADDLDETFSRHDRSPRPSVRGARPDVCEEFDELIRRMMASHQRQRPTPRQVIDTLEQLIPRLSDQRPVLPGKSQSPEIDMACPKCGTQYHLSPDSAGKRMRCPNKLCGAVFEVPLAAEVCDSPTARPLEATVDFPEVLEAEIAEAELADGPDQVPWSQPLEATVATPASDADSPGSQREIPTLPTEAILAETSREAGETPPTDASGMPPAAARARRRKRTSRRQRTRRVKWTATAAMFVLCAVSAAIAWKYVPADFWRPNADTRWTQITDYIAEHKWDRALRELEKYERKFPDDPRNAQIPFFVDLCKAGRDIYSTTGNPERGLASVEQIFQGHRDNPAYELYYIDIHRALDRLVERFIADAEDALDLSKLAKAHEAYEWLEIVTLESEEDWVKQRTAELGSMIQRTDHGVRLALARRKAGELLQKVITDPSVNPDDMYAEVEGILAKYPALRNDQELRSQQESAYVEESSRPRFIREEREEGGVAPGPFLGRDARRGNTMVVVWGDEPGRVMVWSEAIGYPAAAPKSEVVLALGRGILHAFDAQTGRLLWARRLGIDSHRLPGRIHPTDTSPAALIAVSTEKNKLLALEESTGRVRWQYPQGDDDPTDRDAIVATLTIVDRRNRSGEPGHELNRPYGLLPTAEGEIHVLELARGKRLGRYLTGQPMTLGGTYDPKTQLVFFPADAKRVYAIDPAAIGESQRRACRSILLTNHASGALRSPPVVVGRYLIVSETSELERTRLRAFVIAPSGFRSPTVEPEKELTLNGWAWFRPHCTPDRITMVTDEGRLGVFGLNLDNAQEALYRIVADWDVGSKTPYRPLVVHAQEHLVWIMAGGSLQKLSVDVVHERVHPLWQDRAVTGIPVHEAQMDRFARRLFLTGMSPGGRVFRFTAVDAEEGTRLWQRQLGVVPLGDPLAWKDGTLLIDQTGRTLALRPGSNPRAGGVALRDGADDGEVIRLEDPRNPRGPIHLIAPIDDGRKLVVARLVLDPSAAQPQPIQGTVQLESRLHGRPCVCGDFLVVPCADGRLYRVPLPGAAEQEPNEKAFSWSPQRPGPNRAEVISLGPTAVLLIDGGRHVRRLELGSEKQVLQWKQVGTALHLPSTLSGRPLLLEGHLYVFDSQGTLYRLNVDDPGDPSKKKQWPLNVKVTRGPFLRGGRLLAITRQRKLVCIAPDSTDDAQQPLWVAEGFRGRICGMPLLAGDTLLVADNSRRVTGIRLDDGRKVWETELPVRVGPSAAPVPCGGNKMLVPLADGTLLELAIPKPQLARAGR